jgi:hypothetical protein
LGGTAAALRHLPPYAPPMSALSADEPAGAHATREPTEQPWFSPFPPSLAFMEEPWRATPLLRLLIPGLAMPANVSAQAQFEFPAYARRTTSALSPTRQSHLRATGSELPHRGGVGSVPLDDYPRVLVCLSTCGNTIFGHAWPLPASARPGTIQDRYSRSLVHVGARLGEAIWMQTTGEFLLGSNNAGQSVCGRLLTTVIVRVGEGCGPRPR